MADKLSARQQRFVDEYLVDLNATQAAIRAGYAERGARVQGCRLLAQPNVDAAIQRGAAKRQRRTEIDQDRVLKELAAIGFHDARTLFGDGGSLKPPAEWDDDTAAAIAGLEVEELFDGRGDEREHIGTLRKIKRNDKVKALELLGRHLKMFTERVEIEDVTPDEPSSVQERVNARLKRLGIGGA